MGERGSEFIKKYTVKIISVIINTKSAAAPAEIPDLLKKPRLRLYRRPPTVSLFFLRVFFLLFRELSRK
jgi:hypothetical protein